MYSSKHGSPSPLLAANRQGLAGWSVIVELAVAAGRRRLPERCLPGRRSRPRTPSCRASDAVTRVGHVATAEPRRDLGASSRAHGDRYEDLRGAVLRGILCPDGRERQRGARQEVRLLELGDVADRADDLAVDLDDERRGGRVVTGADDMALVGHLLDCGRCRRLGGRSLLGVRRPSSLPGLGSATASSCRPSARSLQPDKKQRSPRR